MLLNRVGILLFALRLFGFLSLSALLFTIILSQQVHRHPIFMNFVCTYLLYNFFAMYLDVVHLTFSQQDKSVVQSAEIVFGTLFDSLKTIGLVATLNLVIHLWFTIRTAFHPESSKTRKLRTFALLVSPYLLGMIPITTLFARNTPRFTIVTNFAGYIELGVVIVTTLWDILLLITYYNHRRILQRANMHRIMTQSLLIRLFIFCVIRLIFTVFLMVAISHPELTAFPILIQVIEISAALYAPLAFCLFGLQREILQIWFPCLTTTTRHDRFTPSEWALDTDITAAAMVKPTRIELSVQTDANVHHT